MASSKSAPPLISKSHEDGGKISYTAFKMKAKKEYQKITGVKRAQYMTALKDSLEDNNKYLLSVRESIDKSPLPTVHKPPVTLKDTSTNN
uniref:Uncharacterized protein n=1 Tax=Amphimedon queenslandica TaxID=400682 RepID=A0A1X7SIH6_AMPQE